MQCAESLRTQAYFDGELDAVSAAIIERHTEHCTECAVLLKGFEQVRTALRHDLPYESAPPALQARIMRALDAEVTVKSPRRIAERHRSAHSWSFWRGVFSGVGGTAIAASVLLFLTAAPFTDPLLGDLVSAHVRSLMPDHLIDVVSTDKHTVKPWFAGHTDVSPVVADFGQQGYRLIGGRADYFAHQRAAVVVYQHGAHVINVFSWEANKAAMPKDTTRNGYHLLFWRAGNLQYCAVSDTAWNELQGLVRLLQELSARDG